MAKKLQVKSDMLAMCEDAERRYGEALRIVRAHEFRETDTALKGYLDREAAKIAKKMARAMCSEGKHPNPKAIVELSLWSDDGKELLSAPCGKASIGLPEYPACPDSVGCRGASRIVFNLPIGELPPEQRKLADKIVKRLSGCDAEEGTERTVVSDTVLKIRREIVVRGGVDDEIVGLFEHALNMADEMAERAAKIKPHLYV